MEFDVKRCQHYNDGICFNEECMTKYCEGYECFFKQFHRLKEENYELQTKLIQAHDDNDEYLEQIKQLEFENEALKQSEQEGLEIVAELKAENEKMYKLGCENYVAIEQAKRLYKLNKCLDEIEEIVNFISNITNCDKAYYCKDKLDEILQKIKEVKMEIKNCEQAKSGDCCYCKNMAYEQLKAENEELKKINEQLATYYPQENNELLKVKQCLDEIKKIVNKYKVGSGNLYGTICIPDVIRIAEKINEVNGNE